MHFALIIICSLFMATFTGLAYIFLSALFSGAERYSGTYSEDTAREFEDLFLFIPPQQIAKAGWAAATVVFITVFILTGNIASPKGIATGLLLATVTGILTLRAPRQILTFLKNRRRNRFNLQLVDTLVNMSNALKAGFSIAQTFEAVVNDGEIPISQEFSLFLQQTRVGVSFSDALQNMDDRVGSEDLTLVVRAIETARKTGGNLTEVFEKIAATIRERMRIEIRIKTLTAQGRLQGIVAATMPLLIGLAILIIDPDMMIPFLHSTIGLIVIIAVLALISLGWIGIRKIVNIDI